MDIIHYEGNGFYIYDENKEILARLEYKRNDNVLIFDHTVVSDKLKGQGIAQKLLDEAVDYARKNNFKVSKRFLKDMIDKINQIKKQNLLITDLPNDEARFILKDITEGSIVINSYSNDIILGAKI